ncbi:MAG: cell surface protein SprA, partial [Crocinitomicaceae bacterium]|nr:cell surface protein SprA [Crocinitomicaceae bacterium]
RQRNERIGIDINTTLQLGQFFGKQARLSLPFFYGYSRGVINPEYDPFNPDVKLKDYDLATRKERAKLGQDFNERRSFNFTNVRKELKAGSKPKLWNVSNVSLTYAFSENLKRDFNTNYDNTKTWTGSLNYNYTFASKGIEPFKKWKPVEKNKNFAIIKDFNLFLLPKNISFSNEYSRIFNQRQIRNNLVPDYEFQPVYLKRFDLVRNYQIGYDLTKNIKTTFSAVNKSIFEEGNHGIDRKLDPEGYREFLDTIQSQINTGGRTMDYSHNYSISYNLPLDKIPLLSWISANTKYTGTFNWQRAPLGQSSFGNIIQNNRAINMTVQGNFINLYNKSPFLKKVLGGSTTRNNLNPKTPDGKEDKNNLENKVPEKIEEYKPEKPLDQMTPKELKIHERKKKKWEKKKEKELRRKRKEKEKVPLVNGFLARMLMTVRNVSGTYALNDGTLLPGFNQETSILGMNGSTTELAGFIFGKQGYDAFGRANGYNVADLARNNNWLVQNENLNTQFTTTHSANLNLKSTLEPLKDLIINLNVTRNYSNNSSAFYRWNPSDLEFQNQSQFS